MRTQKPTLLDGAQLRNALGLDRAQAELCDGTLGNAWPALIHLGLNSLVRHGHWKTWRETLSGLVVPSDLKSSWDQPCPRVRGDITPDSLRQDLLSLRPWRKGPFDIAGVRIESEWRSDLKWQRLQELATPLTGRRVLDVGTGNGYFLLRALGDGAKFVLGLEPQVLCVAQYLALSQYFRPQGAAMLPLRAEQFAADCASFDTVVSMGVLYHCRAPEEHLRRLHGFLAPGGQLVLETLIVPGPAGHYLVPSGRYAGMRNVWKIPTAATLLEWLGQAGFEVDVQGHPVRTTDQEQRSTAWSSPVSLGDFLTTDDSKQTIEGHPAPVRQMVIGRKP